MKLNVDAHLWCLGTYAERYVPGGYFDELSVDEQLEIMSKIDGLSGLFTFYPTPPLPTDPDKLVKKLADHNLEVSNLAVECWADRKWKHGGFSSNEANIRKDSVKLFKEAIDYSKEIQAESVLLWPAHDGVDYPFQCDYRDGWKYMVETIREIGEHDPSVKIAIEYKGKDPRQKQYVSNVGKLMMLLNDVGLENVTGVIDVGVSQEDPVNFAGRDRKRVPVSQPVLFQSLEKSTIDQQSEPFGLKEKTRPRHGSRSTEKCQLWHGNS